MQPGDGEPGNYLSHIQNLISYLTGNSTRAHYREQSVIALQGSECLYRYPGGECARLRENVPYVKVHRYNPKHLYPKLNGYGDNGERKVWSSCGSTYCICFAYCYTYTAHVLPSVSQPSQAHSPFIINRCDSYSEL